ncbi:aspartate aminotransferase [Lacticaseibacillus camelliae DSM 22697 = JCM 13995]|uniref:Aminotransferase n=1 Tax=Lacticaseibacillus camelliae DSM 22697 = JCM 13995 TaxID=1423730 RepID=A0A0R2F1U6_9LACO|nr:aspartate aminotransferase [Lacticaseibacillus camelliae DSM 22697 = JCM 13995]
MSESELETLSPFELSLYLERQIDPRQGLPLLNAGRGNPNWTAPTPREAFFLLGQFAVQETLRSTPQLTARQIQPSAERLARFKTFLAAHAGAGAQFLQTVAAAPVDQLGESFAGWLTQACDAIIGDNYPAPVRCLKVAEQPLKAYLSRELFQNRQLDFDVFPTEGGTAGICYLFDTLMHTGLLDAGNRIALFLPTFAPYLELPTLPHYHFDVVKIRAHQVQEAGGRTSYWYADEELAKLRDPRVKAAFIVNPSNPTANAMAPATLKTLQQLVAGPRPDLMILSDDVYGTFVPQFLSVFAALPHNTALLYSFSKYFGATGWRVGALAVAQDSIFDELIERLPSDVKTRVDARYASVTPDPDDLSFIDRLVADSRDIALNHAAGLSGPQQVMSALFALYGMATEGRAYKREVINICRTREKQLLAVMGLAQPLPALDTAYYCDIDLLQWITTRYGAPFAKYVQKHWTVTKLLVALAKQQHVMLLKTSAFGSSPWAVRVSLANLATSQYEEIGTRLIALMDGIRADWQREALA